MTISAPVSIFAESYAATDPKTVTLTTGVSSGDGIILLLGGFGSTSVGVTSISDSASNTWNSSVFPSSSNMVGVAWARANRAMTTSDTITVNWSGTITRGWIAGYKFSSLSGTSTATVSTSGSTGDPTASLSVGGNSLVVAVYGYGNQNGPFSPALTYSTGYESLDNYSDGTNVQWMEGFYRNNTSTNPANPKVFFPVDANWSFVAVSLAEKAPGTDVVSPLMTATADAAVPSISKGLRVEAPLTSAAAAAASPSVTQVSRLRPMIVWMD